MHTKFPLKALIIITILSNNLYSKNYKDQGLSKEEIIKELNNLGYNDITEDDIEVFNSDEGDWLDIHLFDDYIISMDIGEDRTDPPNGTM